MGTKKLQTRSAHASELRACSCCTVRFRGDLCPQCYVAGCAHKGKGKPCRMDSDTQKTQQMTEFQVREAYATLLREHRELMDAAQRFSTFIYAKDPALIESFYGVGAVSAAAALGIVLPKQKSNGHAEVPPQHSVKSTDARGEFQHG